MKSKTLALLLGLLLAVSLGAGIFLLRPREGAKFAQISTPGSADRIVDLRVDDSFYVYTPEGGYNLVTIQDGKIAVTEATCPDHYCMERGFRAGGSPIVCLPNRLVISFPGTQDADLGIG